MQLISLPISVVYDTRGSTPIEDVIASLQASNMLVRDAVSLLPSFVPGLRVESLSINVERLTQESPLREILVAAILVTFQPQLQEDIPAVIEELLRVDLPDQYHSLLTILFVALVFHGVGLAKDAAARTIAEGPAKRKLQAIVEELAASTGKTSQEVGSILDAKYSRPGPVRTLAKASIGFFAPSLREGARGIAVDGDRIEPEIVADVPHPEEAEAEDFERYHVYVHSPLELHAQDRDKRSSGWAAIAPGLGPDRLRVKIISPAKPHDLWGKDVVVADFTLVSKLTADGYVPDEIRISKVHE